MPTKESTLPGYETELVRQLEQVVLHPEMILAQAAANREFVIRHNDSAVVARRYLQFWGSLL